MSTFALHNDIVLAVLEAAATIGNDAASAILRAEMSELTEDDIEDLLIMILNLPFMKPHPHQLS